MMMTDEDMLTGYIEETQEHLETIEPDLLKLETDPHDMDTVNRLFRNLHSIKGGSGFFGLEKMNTLSHIMENLMSLARTSKIVIARVHIDALLKGLDQLQQMTLNPVESNNMDITDVYAILEKLYQSGLQVSPVVVPSEAKNEPSPQSPEISDTQTDDPKKVVPTPSPQQSKDQEKEKEDDSKKVVSTPSPQQSKGQEKDDIVETANATLSVLDINSSLEDIQKAFQKGMNVYAIQLFFKEDILDKGKTPFQIMTELDELGQYIDSTMDMGEVGLINKVSPNKDVSVIFLFATVIEQPLVEIQLQLPSERIIRLKQSNLNQKISFQQKPQTISTEPASIATASSEETSPQDDKRTPVDEAKSPEPEVVTSAPAIVESSIPTITPTIIPQPKAIEPALKSMTSLKTDESIRVNVSKLNKLVDLAGELVLSRNQLIRSGELISKCVPGIAPILQNLNMVTTELQEEIMNTRMQPIASVFGKFPRLIRELGAQMGKEIELITEGNEVELDKTIIEALSDPLTHIVRNTADHGIEMPETRLQKGKSEKGKLILRAFHKGGQVIIQVSDDGKGIDPEIIGEKAAEKGLISEEKLVKMTEKEKLNLVFLPGFSTSEVVSSVSGRGVGMDVVRTNISQLGGIVEINSVVNQGTTLNMTLPLTMAIVSCLIVESKQERYAIPQVNVEELVMLKPSEFSSMLGQVQSREVLRLRGQLLPLITISQGVGEEEEDKNSIFYKAKEKLFSNYTYSAISSVKTGKKYLKIGQKVNTQEVLRILIVNIGVHKIGIVVDSILGGEEIVVKPMPEYLKHLKSFSGATILGDGTIALILDIHGFVEKNNLKFSDLAIEEKEKDEEIKKHREQQSLLIFDNGTEEQFCIPVPLIQRVDEIKNDQIQHIGDKEYMEYRNQQMRILRLHNFLPIQKPETMSETPNVIIPKTSHVPIGLLINQIIDTKTIQVQMDEKSGSIKGKGLLGSTLIDGKISLLLDLYGIIEMGEPSAIVKIQDQDKDKKESFKILLVEDTPFFIAVIKEYLQSVGHEVVTAINGLEGLKELQNQNFDMVLSDIEMPEMDGWEFIKEIRAQETWKNLPVVALTSLKEEGLMEKGKNLGFNEWLVKLDKEQILLTLSKVIAKSRSMN